MHGAKPFPQLQYTKIVHSGLKHKFGIFLHAEGLLNAPKHHQTSFWVQWSSMDEFGTKRFPQLQYTKIVHSGPKHKFCIFLHAKVFLNAPKNNQPSFGVQWSGMDAFGAKPQLRYTKIVTTKKLCTSDGTTF
jgi:hypothetical protein